ncbi:MAG: hypothetical protein IPN64_08735 [Propionivibrio sp.]|uniref:hypothetical protein n=1 Tax=Propionivibrio sp. TaxID=2212460 RepID=UPI0025EF8CB6|nr:hypothetical protein [Propionivibrio sp.]MBK8894133.1 hypothetical protein [Propionivibrio sp.]
MKAAAEHFEKDVRLVSFEGDRDRLIFRSRWALISADRTFFSKPQLKDAVPIVARKNFQPWKDDYSSIFSILM